MPIVPFDPMLIPAIERFNARLLSGGSDHAFPASSHIHSWFGTNEIFGPDADAFRVDGPGFICWERHLYLHDGEVRGAYMLIRQRAMVSGSPTEVQFLKFPISEGIVDPKFGLVGVSLVKDSLRRAPNLFGLGMGGLDNPLPRVLEKLGAKLRPVPFFYRVLNASNFLRSFRSLHVTPARSTAMDLVAALKLGSIPLAAVNAWQARRRPSVAHLSAEVVSSFGEWADVLWRRTSPEHSFACFRAAGESNDRFPVSDERFIRLTVREGEEIVGWAVLTNTQLDDHKYFGGMRLGAIVDCMAVSGYEPAVAWLAQRHLQESGVDLVVSNQWHSAWKDALRASGFREGPTNFIFATAPALEKAIVAGDPSLTRVHINRGDGDGPINL